MSTHQKSKSKQYLAEKRREHKGAHVKTREKKQMNKKDKRLLIILVSAIVVLTICVGLLLTWLLNGSIFKEKIENGSGYSNALPIDDNGEWADIDIQTPDDMKDGRTQKENVYTFLCCGVDLDSIHADTIMLVTLDMNTKTANVLHILRDTFVHMNEKNYKINTFYARKKSDGMRQIIYNRMGIYPNYYVTLNFKAFRNIVDIIGGVDIDVPFDMRYSDPTQGLNINLKKGFQHLNGDQAEQYVRYRKGSGGDGSDESRQKRQEQFLTSFMQTCIDTCADNPAKAFDILSQMIEHMNTNLSISELVTFAHYGMEIGVENIHFHTLPGEYKYLGKTCFYQGYSEATRKLLNQYINPYEQSLTASRVNFDDPADYGSPYDPDADSDGSDSGDGDSLSEEEEDDPHSSEEDPSSFEVVDESSSSAADEPESSSSEGE
ncbi:MAG: LCP family protein [Clostridia bacterium]|nr:LCP family protein [Clostridia bacterium]